MHGYLSFWSRIFIGLARNLNIETFVSTRVLIGWLKTPLLLSANRVRGRLPGGTGGSAYRSCRNPECFPLWFVFIRLNREYYLQFHTDC